MKIKQLIPVTNDYAVLATRKTHFGDPCYDRKLDDIAYFWALLDSEDACVDEVVLLEVAPDGYQEICERSLVVERLICPICGQKMFPKYDSHHTPTSWQDCMGCGYMLDTSMDATDTEDSCVQAIMRGGENDGE